MFNFKNPIIHMKAKRNPHFCIDFDTPAPAEPKTLLEGMQSILKCAENSALSDKYFKKVKAPMDYLSRHLRLTPTQVTFLVIIMELSFKRCVILDNISDFLNTSNIDVISRFADINTLISLKLVREIKCDGEPNYVVPREVVEAFRRNEVYVYKQPVMHSDGELVVALDMLFDRLDDFPMNKDTVGFDNDVRELLACNERVRLARLLLKVMKQLSDIEFRTLLAMTMYWIRNDALDVEGQRLSFIFRNPFEFKQTMATIASGHSALVKKKLLTFSATDGLQSRGSLSLTPKFRKALTPDRNTDSDELGDLGSQLTRYTDIKAKELFYNSDIVSDIDRLQNVLQPEQMKNIVARMDERGLRGGFTCLLYGGPGTGKTETVLQLARLSGRNIVQVEVSKLRTKWYGESEKLVKGVFDDYRRMVRNSEVAPIMFFNEADAIFARRMEDAERSVDKGENALQNIILQEMETLDGILIATTNLATSLDPAFERRFLYKLHLSKPTPEVKAKIWRSMMPDLTQDEADQLASKFDFSGGQIENIVRKRYVDEIMTGEPIGFETILTLCKSERIASRKATPKPQPIGFLRHAS